MKLWTTARKVARGVACHPGAVARLARDLGGGQPWGLGRTLARELESGERRRAAAALLRDEGVVVRFQHGHRNWVVPSGDLILAEMLAAGCYETDELPSIHAWVDARRPQSQYPVAIEVGANVGTTTIPLCEVGYRVVALEPVPRIRQLLEENLQMNSLATNVLVLPFAVSGDHGVAKMREGDSGSSEIVHADISEIKRRWGAEYFSGRQVADASELTVETRTLESIIGSAGLSPSDVAFVWSDTEGAETGVIEGGKNLWRNGVPLWLEVWPAGLDEHAGIANFIEAVSTSFSGYIERSEIIRGGASAKARPIDHLGQTMSELLSTGISWASTDLLLVHEAQIGIRNVL